MQCPVGLRSVIVDQPFRQLNCTIENTMKKGAISKLSNWNFFLNRIYLAGLEILPNLAKMPNIHIRHQK